MSNTYMDSPDNLIPGRVKGYRLIEGRIKNSEFIDISSRFAAGGTSSTVVDLLKFAKGVMDYKLLSKKTTDEMVEFLKSLGCGKIERDYVGYPFKLLFPGEVK